MEEKRREEWMAILRQSRLCRNLEEKELLNLMEQEGTVRTYSRGERIFQETDRPDSVYMLLNGSVIIAKETFSGKRILLAQLEDPGALFGEVYAFMEKDLSQGSAAWIIPGFLLPASFPVLWKETAW